MTRAASDKYSSLAGASARAHCDTHCSARPVMTAVSMAASRVCCGAEEHGAEREGFSSGGNKIAGSEILVRWIRCYLARQKVARRFDG